MALSKNYHLHVLPLLLLGLFLCYTQISIAQTVSGTVSVGIAPLSGDVVKNISSKKATLSDVNGNLKIAGIKGDTLTAGFMGYKTDTIIVGSVNSVFFHLQPTATLLSEVYIKSNRLTPLAQFKKNQEDYKQIYRIGDNGHLLNVSGDYRRVGVGLSIDALYSNFSKEGKNARRLQQAFVQNYYNDVVDNKFTKELVSRVTGYRDKQLDDFMADNRPTYDFIQTATDYDIITFIQRRIRGIVLQTDKPVAKKAEDKGSKIVFKNPVMKTAPGSGIR